MHLQRPVTRLCYCICQNHGSCARLNYIVAGCPGSVSRWTTACCKHQCHASRVSSASSGRKEGDCSGLRDARHTGVAGSRLQAACAGSRAGMSCLYAIVLVSGRLGGYGRPFTPPARIASEFYPCSPCLTYCRPVELLRSTNCRCTNNLYPLVPIHRFTPSSLHLAFSLQSSKAVFNWVAIISTFSSPSCVHGRQGRRVWWPAGLMSWRRLLKGAQTYIERGEAH